MPAKGRLDDDRAVGQLAVAIGVAETVARPGLDRCRSAARSSHSTRMSCDLAAIGAAVHPHEAADRARDAAQEFEPADAGVARRRWRRGCRIAPPPHAHALPPRSLDLRERLAEPHDHARHAAVADDQVRAERRAACTGTAGSSSRRKSREIGDVAWARTAIRAGPPVLNQMKSARAARRRSSRPRTVGQVERPRSCRRPRLADAVGKARRPFGDVAGAEADHHVARRGEIAQLPADIVGVGDRLRADGGRAA